MRDGLVTVELPGRFQVLPGRPTIVLDVAHNPHAARVLAATLGTMGYFPETLAVFGMLADKDIAGVVAARRRRGSTAGIVATLPGPRGATRRRSCAALLARRASRRARSGRSTTSPRRSPRRGTRRAKLIESSFSDRS